MLKRLYVHNYKCLVNFEINFDQDISLFLGANGSGKSTVFEVLTKLRRLIVNEEKVTNVFDNTDITRWLENQIADTRFELDIKIESSVYKYLLVISLWGESVDIRMKEESLYCNNEMLIESKDKEIILSGFETPLPFDNTRSSISRYISFKASDFLQYLRTSFIVRINPYEMVSTINRSNAEIKTDFSNFAEWFAHLNETNRRGISEFEKSMRDILIRYDDFKIELAGQAKLLRIIFKDNATKKPIIYNFHELSEGQKALFALCTLIHCAPENSLICIDEPENFLALPEIQPWLNVLQDQCREKNIQAILISHHPSLINLLATHSGYWFSRQDNHTRIEKISKPDEDGLSLAQLIEIGWIYGD